jgi:transcriptional regulator with XRE-family HTH domain
MNDPEAMRRRLRTELKRLRVERGLTQRDVTRQLDWPHSKIIRIEQGADAISVFDLYTMLQLYGIDGECRIEPLAGLLAASRKSSVRTRGSGSTKTVVRNELPHVVGARLLVENWLAQVARRQTKARRMRAFWDAASVVFPLASAAGGTSSVPVTLAGPTWLLAVTASVCGAAAAAELRLHPGERRKAREEELRRIERCIRGMESALVTDLRPGARVTVQMVNETLDRIRNLMDAIGEKPDGLSDPEPPAPA